MNFAVTSISRGNKGKTPISGEKSTTSGNNKNSKQIVRKKRQNAEEEETRKAQRLLDGSRTSRSGIEDKKRDSSVVIRMPNGPVMRMTKKKDEELSKGKEKKSFSWARRLTKPRCQDFLPKVSSEVQKCKKKQIVFMCMHMLLW
jgi:hypothetical protein